jgi:tRNA A37 threonylcarbamoyltransferase TsaD
MKQKFILLAIETSCDETAAAVVSFDTNGNITPLSSVVASQINLHKKYGGVFPELASRAHSQKILPVVKEALTIAEIRSTKSEARNKSKIQKFKYSNIKNLDIVSNFDIRYSNLSTVMKSINAIAVTTGPGLIGSLIVGVEFARGLAAALDVPVVPVNHLEGHIYAACGGVNSKFEIRNSRQAQCPNVLNFENSDLRELRNYNYPCFCVIPCSDTESIVSYCSLDAASACLPAGRQVRHDSCRFELFNSRDLDIVSCFDIRASDLPKFPILALVVSGGHTLLIKIKKPLDYEIIGTTLDDAAGEVFDKVARMLGLSYPGGPALEKLALLGNAKAYDFPRAMIREPHFNFSFSGLKTAVFYKLRELGLVDNKAEPIRVSNKLQVASCKLANIRANVAASFQAAVIDVLVAKTLKAAEKNGARSIVIGGGVAANSALRNAFILKSKILNLKSYLSPKALATDNALTIAMAGVHRFLAGDTIDWQKLDANANLKLN